MIWQRWILLDRLIRIRDQNQDLIRDQNQRSEYDTIRYPEIRYDTYDTIRHYNAIEYNAYNAIRCDIAKVDPHRSNPVPYYQHITS